MENTEEDVIWRIWEVNAKQNFIHLDQCEVEWPTLVNTGKKTCGSIQGTEFLPQLNDTLS
jgi:hypothetical protein